MEKQRADPPRTMYTKTAGAFRKLQLRPHKARIPDALHASPEDDDAWGARGDAFTIEAEFDFADYFKA